MKTDILHRTGLAVVCALSPVAVAHHSTAAEFDQNRPVTFIGTVQKVMWMNPHIYTYVEVRAAGQDPVVYHVEGNPPNTLFRQGWRKDSLKLGETVTVSGWRAKNDQSRNVGQATITTADGHKVFSGDGPAKVAE